MNIYNTNLDIFIATYKNQIIAISENKKILKEYMEIIRKLNKNQYNISKENIDSSHYYIKYEDYALTNFYNVYIPNIDIQIIEREYGDIDKELEDLINKLKYFSFIFNRTNNNGLVKDHLSIIKKLEKVNKKPKRLEEINEAHQLNHPILYCDINQYLSFIKMHNDMIDMKKRYKNLCDSD